MRRVPIFGLFPITWIDTLTTWNEAARTNRTVSVSSATRSITLASSRMLPGQPYARSAARASAVSVFGRRP